MELSKMTITDLKSSRDFLLELIADEKEVSTFVNDRTIEDLEKLHFKIRTALFLKVMTLKKAE